ncbi:MAG: polysaccharide biosynthesis/export family protein [Candidatus Thiodiazotropha sp.]|jgi:protein involved in polysaccharide export with SLBB domain
MSTPARLLPLLLMSTTLLLGGCATPRLDDQLLSEQPYLQWIDNERLTGNIVVNSPVQPPAPLNLPKRPDPDTSLPRWIAEPPPLSPGDRVKVVIQNGEQFSGLYEVDIDGALKLPFLPPLPVAGLQTQAAEQAIVKSLVDAEFFHANRVSVSVRVQQWAPVQVHVSGAVFNPGLVSANVRNPEERTYKSLQSSGDFPPERLLPAALRAAGGVRPDAAINAIQLVRNGKTRHIDLSGLMQGHPVAPVALMSGDSIIVPSNGRIDSTLVTTSAITPPGIRVFLSNLATPAPGNAASAIEKHATSLPYGSRLLTAAISANCVGGTNTTNGSRHVVLIQNDPISGRKEAIKRPVDELLRSPEHNQVNPFIMPNDSIACYDSGITNFRDIARTLNDLVLPITLLFLL